VRRREEEEEEAEEGAPSPLARSSADDFFFVFASSPATAASRILTAEARSPACKASTSSEVGAIAYRVCVSVWWWGGGRTEKSLSFSRFSSSPDSTPRKIKVSRQIVFVSFSHFLRRRGSLPSSLCLSSAAASLSLSLPARLSVVTHATAPHRMPAPALALARRPGGTSGGWAVRRGAASSSSSSSSPSNNINHRLCAASSSRPLQSPPSATTRSGGATYERVLRYPDGLVSRLVGLRKEKMGTERTKMLEAKKKKRACETMVRGHKGLLPLGAPGRFSSTCEGLLDDPLYAL